MGEAETGVLAHFTVGIPNEGQECLLVVSFECLEDVFHDVLSPVRRFLISGVPSMMPQKQ